MSTLVTILHVLVSFVLIVVILLQAGKGGGVGAALGGGGAASVFGSRGASTFLTKLTGICAAVFMITSVTLSFFSSRSASVVRPDGPPPASTQQAPASPIGAPQQGAPEQAPQQAPAAPESAPQQPAPGSPGK